jgi:D-aminopeptidase
MQGIEEVTIAENTMPTTPDAFRQQPRPRARDVGIVIGDLPTGKFNAITDVAGVSVGHATVIEGDAIRTGVTVVMPHAGNVFQEKVPAAVYVGNGFGKLVGSTQIEELGNVESPIALTNTLNVWKVADALVDYMLHLPGNESVRSINVVVGETNDGQLNDIRGRAVTRDHVLAAIGAAKDGPVDEGSVGAGTGTICFGWKGGIGTASRLVADHTVGVLVQTNFGGSLTIAGTPIYKKLSPPKSERTRPDRPAAGRTSDDGSCMIIVATDAPLDSRNLRRLAARALAGMARTGASFSNGSGDYAIAFSTSHELRIGSDAAIKTGAATLANDAANPLFRAVIETTEEAIINSLLRATDMSSRFGSAKAIPVEDVVRLVKGGEV